MAQAALIVTGELASQELVLSFETHNRIHGRTNNPFDLGRSPGGNSCGRAGVIAAGLTSFDIGTDYGGSIGLPSHACGSAGIKPTNGSASHTGLCLLGMAEESIARSARCSPRSRG